MIKKILIIIMVSGLGIFLIFLGRGIIGISKSGTVEKLYQIPLYGKYFEGLQTQGNINYLYHQDYRRYSFAVCGKIVSEKDLIMFCKNNKLEYEANYRPFPELKRQYEIWGVDKIKCFVDIDKTDFFIIGEDKRVGSIEIYYYSKNRDFVLFFSGDNIK